MTIGNEIEIQPRQVRHWVADKLRNAILEGQIKPGEWLRQERLAQEFGVSQMPVREAFKELQAEGLVQHVPYRGVRAVEFTPDDVEDLYSVRSYLEGRAAHAAARNITPAELSELESLLAQMEALFPTELLPAYRQANRRFHLTIIKASQRDYLLRTLYQLWTSFPTMLWSNLSSTSSAALPERDANDPVEHEAIFSALESRESDRAEALVRQHINNAGRQLVAALRAQPEKE